MLVRACRGPLQVRGGDGRTVCGTAVPYGSPAEIFDGSRSYTEVFRRGAFAKSIAERGQRVPCLAQHDRKSLPLGVASLLEERADGLYCELAVSATRHGDEVLQLVADGALDGLSVGFQPITDRMGPDGVVERLEARLVEISVVTFPAYDSARVAAVRQAGGVSCVAAERRLGLLERTW